MKSSQCMHAYLCMSVFVSELFVCLRLLCLSVSPSFLSWQSFGPETQSIITLNLPAGVFPFVVKGCLCFSLYFTYPGKLGSLKFSTCALSPERSILSASYTLVIVFHTVMMFPVSKILERMFCSAPDNGNYIIGVRKSLSLSSPLLSFILLLPLSLQTALRIGLVILSGLIVVVIPNFSTLMALIGSSCCTLLAFILPGIFHYVLFRE